jgi:flavodoxin
MRDTPSYGFPYFGCATISSMEPQKTLVVFYSSGGITRKVGEAIARSLECPLEEIVPQGRSPATQKVVPIQPPKQDPGQFDLIVIGTPVWGNAPTPPVRAYLQRFQGKLPKLAFFCTFGIFGGKGTMAELEKLAAKPPVATFAVWRFSPGRRSFLARLKEFTDKLRQA